MGENIKMEHGAKKERYYTVDTRAQRHALVLKVMTDILLEDPLIDTSNDEDARRRIKETITDTQLIDELTDAKNIKTLWQGENEAEVTNKVRAAVLEKLQAKNAPDHTDDAS